MTEDRVTLLAAIVVGVIASARLVRLVVSDEFPPVEWVKVRWLVLTGESKWSKLVRCPWCLAPYFVAADLAAAVLSDLHWAWWVVNLWLAASYAASWIVFHDED